MSAFTPAPPRLPVPDPHVRVSDAEREATVAELRHHHTEGRIALDELDDRVGAAYQARTAGELARVLQDLPAPLPPPPPPPSLWSRVTHLAPPGALIGAVLVGALVTGHPQFLGTWPLIGVVFFTFGGRRRHARHHGGAGASLGPGPAGPPDGGRGPA